jgi:hypothetical protein
MHFTRYMQIPISRSETANNVSGIEAKMSTIGVIKLVPTSRAPAPVLNTTVLPTVAASATRSSEKQVSIWIALLLALVAVSATLPAK